MFDFRIFGVMVRTEVGGVTFWPAGRQGVEPVEIVWLSHLKEVNSKQSHDACQPIGFDFVMKGL